MARPKKKGTSGAAKEYLTRSQAVRKLQVSLPDFRRLCIFKGIFPREPRSFKKVSKVATHSTTFYYTRDIQYLLHEPVLAKFREHKTFAKKLARALGRGDTSDAARLERTQKPRVVLDHLVRERYPTFQDALRDLDDALCLLFLFANLPSTTAVPPQKIAQCERLCLEFEHYLIVSHSLRKSFLSIKGIYYQATIKGQDIMWLVPYQFAQAITADVDFRIMATFVEFYTTLLSFVNFKLYTEIGLVYPPKLDKKSEEEGGGLRAFTLEGKGQAVLPAAAPASIENGTALSESKVAQQLESLPSKLATLTSAAATDGRTTREQTPAEEETNGTDTLDTFKAPIAEDADVLLQPSHSDDGSAANLFTPFTFFLSRETPRQPLEFLLRAFGCRRIGWSAVLGDGAVTNDELDPSITHQIVDKPPVAGITPAGDEVTEVKPGMRVPGRTYIQPQWVWDCVNAGQLVKTDKYAPGALLPPHLSPWIQTTNGGYDPSAPLEDDSEDEMDVEVSGKADGEMTVDVGEADEESEESAEEVEVEDEDEEWGGLSDSDEVTEDKADGGSSSEREDDEEDDEDRDVDEHELLAESLGVEPKPLPAKAPLKPVLKKKQAEAEELERQMMMMPRKKRKLLEKMMYGKRKAEDEAKTLRRKRRMLEKGATT